MDQWSIGNAGWVRLQPRRKADRDGFVLVRFAEGVAGRLVLSEVYMEGAATRTGTPLRWERLETVANHPDIAPTIRARLTLAGPDLRRLASHYGSTFGHADDWVAASMYAQLPESGIPQAPAAKEPPPVNAPVSHSAVLSIPEGRKYGPDFYADVARVYKDLAAEGRRSIAPVIAETNGVTPEAVRSWFNTCRELGFLPKNPGRGKVSA